MEKFGYLVPVIINENYEIGDGAHRVELYKAMGLTEIPAYIVPKINNDIERRLLRQTMNKLRGEHDIKLDADEMALIFEAGQLNNLAQLIAQQQESLENILTKHKGIMFQHEDNFDIDKALEDLVPETQLGDIWQLGQHRIICADCSDEKSISRLMEGKKADMVFTDPPYGMNYKGRTFGKEGMENDDESWKETVRAGLETTLSIFKDGIIAMFFGSSRLDELFETTKGMKFHRLLTIYKPNRLAYPWHGWILTQEHILLFSIGKYKFNQAISHHDVYTFDYSERPPKEVNHPTVKPISIIIDVLHKCSNNDEIIFDPFLGSGSTLIACEQTNRVCYGVEIDPHYCDVVVKRWEAYTGAKATLIRGESVIGN
jgi:DNA modification methylase